MKEGFAHAEKFAHEIAQRMNLLTAPFEAAHGKPPHGNPARIISWGLTCRIESDGKAYDYTIIQRPKDGAVDLTCK